MFDIGDVVRKMRKERGWTQEELGKRAGGLNKETVSSLEQGNNPRLDTLKKIAAAFGFTTDQLFNVRSSRFEPVPPESDVEFVPNDLTGYKRNDLPVIAEGDASPDPAMYWDNEGVLKDHVDERMSRPSDVRDANAYGVKVRGDSMEPMFRPGMRLIVSPNVPVGDGDAAYVQLRSGERLLKLVTRSADGFVLESVNAQYRPRFVREDEVEHIHRIAYARFLR